MMLSIYQYSDPHQFLRDAWTEKKQKNPAFSMRAWARKLGLKSNAPLSLMLAGKRGIPKKTIPQFVQSLGLSKDEGFYLDSLVSYANAKKPEEQEFYLDRLRSLNPDKLEPMQVVEVETFHYVREPLHTLLMEMVDLKEFKADPAWIQSRVAIKVTQQRIDECLDRLVALGLLRQDPASGNYIKTHRHVSSVQDVTDLGVQEYHRRSAGLAGEMISQQNVLEREFGSYSFNLKKEVLPEAKKRIRSFIEDFFREFEAPAGEGQETYQLNVHLFGLTCQNKEDGSGESQEDSNGGQNTPFIN